MRRAILLVAALLAAGGFPRDARARKPPQLSDEERAFCESELEVLERRTRIFQTQGVSAAEIERKNEPLLQVIDDCRERFRSDARRTAEQQQDLEEAARRAGPNATELERNKAWREVRRERLASRSAGKLTEQEKKELAAGEAEEVAATHATLDAAHARDPRFMRLVHSALECFHGARKAQLQDAISSEEALLKLGNGDRQRLYALKTQLHESVEVLERNREIARSYEAGLERCTNTTIAILTHCLAIKSDGDRTEPSCESEQIQQYVRLVK